VSDAKGHWLEAAERYVADCRARATAVRASEFAARMNLTPVQLVRHFHASVGICVKEYLRARQIERAQQLLRDTRQGTAEIATAAGFGTARSFYRAFRLCTGMSPTEYRQEMSLAKPDF
jgi:AraC-like DNA-binding protein